nr:UDP-N-acetylmuramate dehydrogenase [uncultured Glaciecola sp.]
MVPLKKLHTFGFETSARDLVEINTEADLFSIFDCVNTTDYYLLGEGSNSVFLEDYSGTIILNKLTGIDVQENSDEFNLSVASGESWHSLVEYTLSIGAFGFENLALIPGTVGAAPIQNIGAYGVEIEKFISSVEYYDIPKGCFNVLSHLNCAFAYRDSIFKHRLFNKAVITKVNFTLPKKNTVESSYAPLNQLDKPTPHDVFHKVIEVRREKLPNPKVLGNAGSFFKNPVVTNEILKKIEKHYNPVPHFRVSKTTVKIPAAWLIDQLGFKGKMYLGVKCHERQPLVLVNIGNGNGEGLLMLAREIKQDVYNTFAIELENEVRLVGNRGLISL